MSSCIMLARPPSLLMTRRPSSCIPNDWPPARYGRYTQYQKYQAASTMAPISSRTAFPAPWPRSSAHKITEATTPVIM